MFEAILNFLFPPKCPACQQYIEHNGEWCEDCLDKVLVLRRLPLEPALAEIFTDGIWCMGDYDGPLKKLIADMKFEKKQSAIKALKYFTNIGVEKLAAQQSVLQNINMTVPVPLHKSKLKKRGFNQSIELFHQSITQIDLDFQDYLSRVRNTEPQFGLDQHERQKNLKDAFEISDENREKIVGKNILLVDDIFTTGATFFECGKSLKRAGAVNLAGLVVASGRK